MKVVLIGATGYVGSHVCSELLSRGHQVSGIARRHGERLAQPGFTALSMNVSTTDNLPHAFRGHDAVILCAKYNELDPAIVIRAVKAAGIARLLVVGGAGSLQVAPGVDLVDTPQLPDRWKPEARAARDLLLLLKEEKEIDWTFLSPSALLQDGARTGRFRYGDDDLLVGADGQSRISLQDLALALVDELEQARYSRRRFTVGY